MGMMDRFFGRRVQGASLVPSIPRDAGPRVIGAPQPRAGYLRENQNIVLKGFNPSLRASADDVRLAWQASAAQAVWFMQNSGFIAGIFDQAVASVVGTGLQLKLKPDAFTLGWSEDASREWARGVENRFNTWANRPIECDAEGRKNFGQLQATGYRMWMAYGEQFASLPYKARPGAAWRTKVKMIPAHLCLNKSDYQGLVQGVRLDELGYPVAYLFRRGNQISNATDFDMREIEIASRDSEGRAQVIHVFDGMAGQVRGITIFAPVLKVTKQYDQLADATLTASILQSVFAAVLESDAPTMETLKAIATPAEQGILSPLEAYLAAQSGWGENVQIDLSMPGRIAHLFPGQKLNFLQNEHPNSQYVDFASFLLREIARCAGMTYESATGNYTDATYSSTRMATSDIFPITLYRRKNIVAPLCQEVFEAWLEEDIEQGWTKFPGGVRAYNRNRAAAARAIWRGAGKPQADDLKTAKAHEIWARMGVMSNEEICAELGTDYEDVLRARAEERALRQQYGEAEPQFGAKNGAVMDGADNEEASDNG